MNKIFFFLIFLFLTGCFNTDKKLLMKCADIEFDKQWVKKYGEPGVTKSLGNDLKLRFEYKSYVRIYRMCELELSASPETFRQIYR
ncbi:hypothetical protein OAT23_03445 [Candidatus Pelagibacter sp.]|nr:hypothetical protein [Candidatus Pelagibacter sp.]